jgi:hypothetical protein
MLVVTEYAKIKPYIEQLRGLGYGFSVLEEPTDDENEKHDWAALIDMLRDWGWNGADEDKPYWVAEGAHRRTPQSMGKSANRWELE